MALVCPVEFEDKFPGEPLRELSFVIKQCNFVYFFEMYVLTNGQ